MRGQIALELFFAFTFAILMALWLNGFSGVVEKNNAPVMRAQLETVANDLFAVSQEAVIRNQVIEMPAPCVTDRGVPVPLYVKFIPESEKIGTGASLASAVPKLQVIAGDLPPIDKQLLFPFVIPLGTTVALEEPVLELTLECGKETIPIKAIKFSGSAGFLTVVAVPA